MCANGNGWATLHSKVKGQPDCILGRHCAAYTADVSCCSLTALPGSVSVGETPSWACLSAASEGGFVTFSVSLRPSIPAGSLPTLHLSWRRNTQPEHEMRFRESLQILSFVEWLSPQTSLNKHCISSQNVNSSTLSSVHTVLFLSFQFIWLLLSSDHIIILSRFSGRTCPLFQRLYRDYRYTDYKFKGNRSF